MGRPKGIPCRGHQVSRGLRMWQKVHAESGRNRKHFAKTKHQWAIFRETAGIHGNLSVGGALKKLNDAGCPIDRRTLTNWINGFTDCKLSSAIDVCATLDCPLEGFARAMVDAWELAERRWATEQAMNDALAPPEETP